MSFFFSKTLTRKASASNHHFILKSLCIPAISRTNGHLIWAWPQVSICTESVPLKFTTIKSTEAY